MFVVAPAPRLSNSILTDAKSAISTANAIRAIKAAKNATRDAKKDMILKTENIDKMNANAVTTAAARFKKHQNKKRKTWYDS